ncbi:helix-turn-helix transcriptional regulator [Bifidobacterium sp. SO4]|uniref:helix-turn-helix domain-containing protein n=1 Tax=Bifidobacterium sp. SO4 TaxID=2809030 RepID=UPI001BDD14DE|nr:helix-turn-helix transcriptional regulator [Bifidobacterium sp. SO4]MBT1169969.1 helix-turn-helix transcriptional regulator [Bifidobacterium sp. SO4]
MRAMSGVVSMSQLAVTIRDARIAHKMTQAELAERAGLTRPWVSQFEQGKIINASFTRVLSMCQVLGVTMTLGYDAPDCAEETDAEESRPAVGSSRTDTQVETAAKVPVTEVMPIAAAFDRQSPDYGAELQSKLREFRKSMSISTEEYLKGLGAS